MNKSVASRHTGSIFYSAFDRGGQALAVGYRDVSRFYITGSGEWRWAKKLPAVFTKARIYL